MDIYILLDSKFAELELLKSADISKYLKCLEDIKEIETGFDDTFTNYLKDVYKRYKNNDIDTINKEFKDSTEEFLNFKKELKWQKTP